MKKFIKLKNEGYGEEARLYDVTDELGLTMEGDYYHDKIDEKIQGFFLGLDYSGIKYEVVSSWFGYVEDGFDMCDIKFSDGKIYVTCEDCNVEEY